MRPRAPSSRSRSKARRKKWATRSALPWLSACISLSQSGYPETFALATVFFPANGRIADDCIKPRRATEMPRQAETPPETQFPNGTARHPSPRCQTLTHFPQLLLRLRISGAAYRPLVKSGVVLSFLLPITPLLPGEKRRRHSIAGPAHRLQRIVGVTQPLFEETISRVLPCRQMLCLAPVAALIRSLRYFSKNACLPGFQCIAAIWRALRPTSESPERSE